MHPERLGPYRIGPRLGRGGMGSVYEAVDTATGRTVAVKVLAAHLADDPGLQARFRAEIDTLKELRHPAIVQLLAFGEEDDQPYFAMELVRGKSIEQELRAGRRFTWRETVSTAIAVARALKVAHDHGVIHRDLKPSNLLLADGATPGDGVKLADFGIAKLFGAAAHTAHGNIVGTAEYMAPEQAAGQPVDHRADLYSLGLVMYAMLVGRPPFRGAQVTEVIEQQRRTPAPRVSLAVAGIPPEVDAVVDRLLAKDPAARPASALALVRLLTALETLVPDAPAAGPRDAEQIVIDDLPAAPGAGTALPATGERTTIAGPFAAPAPRADGVDAPRETPTLRDAGPSSPPRAVRPHGTAAGDGDATRAEPESAAAETRADGTVRSRHTTLAELDRADAERRARIDARRTAWQWTLAATIAVAVLGGGAWLLRPPSADDLYERIKAVSTAEDRDLRDAADTIRRFLERHPDDPRAGEVAALERTLAVDRLERRARRKSRPERLLAPLERDYRAAMAREADSPSACIEALEALVALDRLPAESEDAPLWIDLARRQIARLAPLALEERQQDETRIAEAFAAADELAADAARRPGAGAERRRILEGIVGTYAGRPHAREAVERARSLLAADADAPDRTLPENSEPRPDTEDSR